MKGIGDVFRVAEAFRVFSQRNSFQDVVPAYPRRSHEPSPAGASAKDAFAAESETKPTMPSWWEAGSFWCAVCQTEDADFANEAAPGVCRWCMPFVRKMWWRRAAQAEGRSHSMTEASFVDGLVIRMREAYWKRVRALQLTVPMELFSRAPVERWRGSG